VREGITVEASAADRTRLEAIVSDRNSPQKHVWRARIVLLTADGLGTSEIMRRTGTSKVTVWRWQERFMTAGVDGLLRDKTRPSRIPPLPAPIHERTVASTLADPPGEATHWTATMMAKAVGISVSSVQRIWRAHGLQLAPRQLDFGARHLARRAHPARAGPASSSLPAADPPYVTDRATVFWHNVRMPDKRPLTSRQVDPLKS